MRTRVFVYSLRSESAKILIFFYSLRKSDAKFRESDRIENIVYNRELKFIHRSGEGF